MDIRESTLNLLTQHDCAIIPGFGGFIANYTPARIDPAQHAFYPPSKKLLFNVQLKQNDGLLVHTVANTGGISYPEAGRMVEQFAEECRSALQSGRNVVFPGIGQLYTGHEGIIYFEQDTDSNLLPESFGLSRVMSPPILRHHETGLMLPEIQTEKSAGRETRRYIPAILRWAAIFAIPIGMATLVGMLKYNRVSPDIPSRAGIMTPVVSGPVARTTAGETNVPAAVSRQPESVTEMPKPAVQPTDRAIEPFAVIVGAFRIRENADKLVSRLQQQGYQSSIYDQSKTGLYRVCLGTSKDRTGAADLLAAARSASFGGAWILAK